MPRRRFTRRGRFTPKNQPGRHNAIDVNSPQLAQFLATLESGSSVLSEEIVSTEAVGSVSIGDTFPVGTSLEEIIRRILEGTLTAGIQSFVLLDENLDPIDSSTRIAGDEITVGGVRFIYDDPGGLVQDLTYTPVDATPETVTGTEGTTNSVDVTTDYTAGGPSSDFSYTFASGGDGNISKLQTGFALKLNDTEGNQIGSTKNATLSWTPPAFMLNLTGFNATNLINVANDPSTWEVLQAILIPYLRTALSSLYYPLIRHSTSGNYTGSDVDNNNNPITWEYPAEYATGHLVGFGNPGGNVTFWGDGTSEYKQVWFMPAGGQATTYSGATVGGLNYNPEPTTGVLPLDISSDPTTGLEFSTSTEPCLVQYRLFVGPQTNSIFPGTTPPIIFNA